MESSPNLHTPNLLLLLLHHSHVLSIVLLSKLHLLIWKSVLVLLNVGRLHCLVLARGCLDVDGIAVGLKEAAEATTFRDDAMRVRRRGNLLWI